MNTPRSFSSKFRLFAFTLVALSPLMASAHPGHSLFDASAAHVLTSPYHIMMLAFGGVTLWSLGRMVQRRVPAMILSGTGVAMLVGAVVLFGASL